jgi:hypothetical protein
MINFIPFQSLTCVSVIQGINRIKDKNHTITSIDAEKAMAKSSILSS